MENKSKLSTVLLIIIIILLGVGLTYIFLNNNSKQKVGDTSSLNNLPQDNQNTTNQIPVTQTNTNKNTTAQDNNIITKTDWGISFTKTSDWSITNNTSSEISLNQILGQQGNGDTMTIQYISGDKITSSDAKFGSITYYYDENGKQWVETDNECGCALDHTTPVPAIAVAYTKDNLPVFKGTGRWLTYIVPLSHTIFLELNITGSGQTQPLRDLLQTIKKI